MTHDDLYELFRPLAPVTLRRMFGGTSVYLDGRILAIEVDGVVYLKADQETQARFEEEGLKPFTYEAKGKTMTMRYYQTPDEAYEDPDALRPWFRLAMEASARAQLPKKKAKR
jgi:DNA transformation protein